MKNEKNSRSAKNRRTPSALKKGDTVIVISGGHAQKRPIKGKIGKILEVSGERVKVEGVNTATKYRKPTPQREGGAVVVERAMHISNVMFYVEKLKKAVRLKTKALADGTRVRGYLDPSSKTFVQLEN